MTKKHFIALADAIKNHNEHHKHIERPKFEEYHILALADFCAEQNPNFNRERWIKYINGECGKNGGKVKHDHDYVTKKSGIKICSCGRFQHKEGGVAIVEVK